MGKRRSNKNKKGSRLLQLKKSGSVDDVRLPQDLITEILIRLPVKPLFKFKSVSKSGLSLISNPHFIRYHSSMEPNGFNLHLLYVSKATMTMKKCRLYSAMNQPHPSTHLSRIDEFPARTFRRVIGIINGLICVHYHGTVLCVWNPALNKVKRFNFHPEPPSGTRRRFSFGYEESNDDYKVVCLQTVKGGNDFGAEVSIYSLKADSWRRIEPLKGFCLPDPGVFANGKIYWLGDLVTTPKRKIVSLDMLSEKFVELQHPDFDAAAGDYLLQLGVSGGRLFVLCDSSVGEIVDLWVLDKCGVEETWCKLVSFTYTDVNHKFRSCYDDELCSFDYRVVCILSNGEIVFGNDRGLLVYNGKKRGYCKIKMVVDTTTCWMVEAYVESLVWPNYA